MHCATLKTGFGAAFALVAFGCGKPVAPPPPVPHVTTYTIAPRTIALFTELAGRTSPYQIADVVPQETGIIISRPFREGSDVRANQTLYQLDPAPYKASYDTETANLASARASLISANLLVARYKILVEINAVSKQTNDDAVSTANQAAAAVLMAKAEVETAKINLDRTRIGAPISGRIGRSALTVGALVATGQSTALSTIQQMDPMYVDATQSVSELLRLQRDFAQGKLKSGPNQIKVKLLLEDGSAYPLEGTLEFSEVTVDETTGSVTLRALFPNPRNELLPGMFVREILEEGTRENAILVPQQGVTHAADGGATALVLGSNDKVELRHLHTDRAIDNQWLVNDGLKMGDRVIVDGLQKVKPGGTAIANVPVPSQVPRVASATAH